MKARQCIPIAKAREYCRVSVKEFVKDAPRVKSENENVHYSVMTYSVNNMQNILTHAPMKTKFKSSNLNDICIILNNLNLLTSI